MKKIRTKRKKVDYLQQQKRQKINANIRDDLLLELDKIGILSITHSFLAVQFGYTLTVSRHYTQGFGGYFH